MKNAAPIDRETIKQDISKMTFRKIDIDKSLNIYYPDNPWSSTITREGSSMSADQASSTEKEIIYVKLIDEMVDVWRPVSAMRVGSSVYKILPEGFDPDVETWEFLPGEEVKVEAQEEPGGKSLIAVARVAAG